MVVPLALGVAWGAYSGYKLYGEMKWLSDYQRRYRVRVRYPVRTSAFGALGSSLSSASMGYYGYKALGYIPQKTYKDYWSMYA